MSGMPNPPGPDSRCCNGSIRLARQPGSLLVLSTHGRTGWRAVAPGNVARRVVSLADGPLVLVRL